MSQDQQNTARTTADAAMEGRMKADMGKAKRKILRKKLNDYSKTGQGGCGKKKY